MERRRRIRLKRTDPYTGSRGACLADGGRMTNSARTVAHSCLAFGLSALAAAASVGCERNKSEPFKPGIPGITVPTPPEMPAKPSDEPGPKTATSDAPQAKDPMADLDKDMARVLAEAQGLGAKPIESLKPAEARQQPTLTDAVKSILKKDEKPTAPEAVAKVQDRNIPGGAGNIPVRIYMPSSETTPLPVIVYYHGGGFVIASNDVYDATPRALANGARAVVVSVEYRKGPEHKFPAAHDDAFAAYKWTLKNAGSFGGDAKRVAVAGESAGGNLAANVAIAARDKQERLPVHLLLVYPVASSNMSSDSYVKYAEAKPLNKNMMTWFTEQYFAKPEDGKDPRINLVAANLKGLPETTIINAEIDPLLSDGKELADKLKDAGVSVKQKTYEGVTHEFFGLGAVVDDAKDAVKLASERLRDSFEDAAKATDATALGK
jgi:acetyl esterase